MALRPREENNCARGGRRGKTIRSGLYKLRARRFRRGMPWPCIALDLAEIWTVAFDAGRRWGALNPNRGDRWDQRVSASIMCPNSAKHAYCSPPLARRRTAFARSSIGPTALSHAHAHRTLSPIRPLPFPPPTPSHSCLVRRRPTCAPSPPSPPCESPQAAPALSARPRSANVSFQRRAP